MARTKSRATGGKAPKKNLRALAMKRLPGEPAPVRKPIKGRHIAGKRRYKFKPGSKCSQDYSKILIQEC